MRALVVEEPNVARVEERPIPECDPDEVLIRVVASGVCGTDVHILRGEYLGSYPIVPGHESAGIVEAVGRKVTGF